MDTNKSEKVLLAFDGSFHAMEAARYISGIPAFRRMEIVVFSVFSTIPEAYYDLQAATPLPSRVLEIHAWEFQQEKEMEEAAEKARQVMMEKGVPSENISVFLRERKKGVARDIIEEAKKDYAAVVMGRKGVSRMKDLVMGGIAAKLLEKVNFAPLLVVGRNSSPERVLIAMDISDSALKAADFASRMLGDSDCEVLLASVIHGTNDEYTEAYRQAMVDRFQEVSNFLVEAGMPRAHIETSIVSGAESCAGVICRTADEGQYGTIVLGRRGLSKVKEFFMGRVTNKVITLTRDQAVWIVN